MKRTLTYVVLGTVLLLSGCLLFIANWADAAGSDRISFASNRSGNLDIYIMNSNGERLRRLTTDLIRKNNSGPPWPPDLTWSPDGHFLAYTSNRDGNLKTYIMDTKTREHRRLTDHHEGELYPAWSPDGKWIAYVAGDAGRSHIYKTDVNGAHPVELTDPGYYGRPAWSPDGKQIAFVSLSHDKVGMRNGLYVMNANGKRLRRVPGRNRGRLTSKCAWSPDGKQIAFSIYIPQTERYHLCVIDVDGENFRQLTQGDPIVKPLKGEKQKPVNVHLPRLPLPEIYSPAWSPDGKRIAYVYSDTILRQTADIYIIDAKGNERGTPLVKERGIDVSPAWVPEGFLSVSPSAEKQTTLWGRLKQMEGTSK
ncbi:MAG: hypothetical protein F4Z56_04775 [Candidatus Dadabacteria bacterium]|nr:hypothetical protein [Candidatus Dadabacteria bacterium]MYC76947.1 hypothetical protein [Candidatus Poribacteria bacterium]